MGEREEIQLNLPIAATDITMLSRRIATARPLRNAIPIVRRAALNQQRGVAQAGPEYPKLTDVEDPGMVSSLDKACPSA